MLHRFRDTSQHNTVNRARDCLWPWEVLEFWYIKSCVKISAPVKHACKREYHYRYTI